jgi:ribonuclease VapC
VTLVVDSSAVLSIVLNEPDAPTIAKVLAASTANTMSSVSLVETTIVAEARLGPTGGNLVQRVLREASISITDVTADTALDALDAWRSYGKGRHRASLNLGDCFTYALALRSGKRVLCIGEDFAQTDLIVLPQ